VEFIFFKYFIYRVQNKNELQISSNITPLWSEVENILKSMFILYKAKIIRFIASQQVTKAQTHLREE